MTPTRWIALGVAVGVVATLAGVAAVRWWRGLPPWWP